MVLKTVSIDKNHLRNFLKCRASGSTLRDTDQACHRLKKKVPMQKILLHVVLEKLWGKYHILLVSHFNIIANYIILLIFWSKLKMRTIFYLAHRKGLHGPKGTKQGVQKLVRVEDNAALNLCPILPGPQKLELLVIFLFILVKERAVVTQVSRGSWWEGAIGVPDIWVLLPHTCITQKGSHS